MKKSFLIVLLFGYLKVGAQTSTFIIADSLFEKGRYKLALLELDKKIPIFFSNYKKVIIYESLDNYKKTAECSEKTEKRTDGLKEVTKTDFMFFILLFSHNNLN